MSKLPAHERALIACALHDPRRLHEAAAVRPDHLVSQPLAKAWGALLELDAAQKPISSLAVAEHLGQPGAAAMLESCRTVIATGAVRAAQLGYHAEQVVDAAIGRAAREALIDAEKALRDPATSKREAVADILQRLEAVEKPPARRQSGRDLLIQLWERCEEWRLQPEESRTCNAVPTGYRSLDRVTGGLRRGQLHILAGDTSAGKSSFANGIVDNALVAGHTVDLYGYEDEPSAVMTRIAARVATDVPRLTNFHLQQGDLNGADPTAARQAWEAYAPAAERLTIIHERPTSITDLCLQIRDGVARREADLVVIDYVQLLKRLGTGTSAYERLSHLSDELHHTFRRTNAAGLVLSQLRRPDKQQQERKPSKHDLKDCGDLEQAAFTVMLLWNRQLTQRVAEGQGYVERLLNVVELLVAKNKNGPLLDTLLRFGAAATTFWDLDSRDVDDRALMDAYKAASRGR